MKFRVVSDLHLEFGSLVLPEGDDVDVLLLAGDVCVAAYLQEQRNEDTARKHKKACRKFFDEECVKYKKVFYIPGNHEHYTGVYEETLPILKDFLRDTNVDVVDRAWLDLDEEVRLYAGTLWTDMNNDDWFAKRAAKDGMNDFHIIHVDTPVQAKFTPERSIIEHRITVDDLKNGLNTDHKIVVMTHHCPTTVVHPKYARSPTNPAYGSDLSKLILDHPNIKLWVHGHMHDSFDYMVGDCRVVCNPRGYHKHELNPNFNPGIVLEV